MAFFLKASISFPIFFLFIFKLFWKIFKKRKKSFFWCEESRYLWVKRYSRYLLWLYGNKFSIKNKKLWNEKGAVVFLKSSNPFLPLFLIKINDFEKESPFSFFFSSNFKKELPYLVWKFYSLINPFNNNYLLKDFIKNIKFPRTLFCLFTSFDEEKIIFFVNVAKNAFVKIITNKIKKQKKINQIEFINAIKPEKLIKLNQTFVSKNIENKF